jgi:putative heme degradation protein
MTEPEPIPRQALRATPAELAPLLPALGRVMVVLSAGGATHERIGALAAATIEHGRLILSGEAHHASLDLGAVHALVLDRTARMRDKIYPRLEFCDAGGAAEIAVIGMDGPEPFDAALAPFAGAPLIPAEAPARPAEVPETADAGAAALQSLHAAGAVVEVRLTTGGATQAWSGTMPEIRLAMGFANIITPDFHLHLRLGSVARFEQGPAGWAACDENGVPIGLLLRPADAAGEAALAALA